MITLKIANEANRILAETTHENSAQLVYDAAYTLGDKIVLECDDAPCFLTIALDDAMPSATVYMTEKTYELAVPFDEQKNSYCQKCFSGEKNFIYARKAANFEIDMRRNLAFNPYDGHKNTALFPHAAANVETRGEAVFAARNAINGNTANQGHGNWPFESWGIQRREDAEFCVNFGRKVTADSIGLTIRCDFPHDNWWHTVSVEFSDGSCETLSLKKTCLPQYFAIAPREIEWAKLCQMKKDEKDESPFPALTALEIIGK